MHSTEHARRGHSQRRRPDLPNINTTAGTRSLTRDSQPQTPPFRKPAVPAKGHAHSKNSAGSRALKQSAPPPPSYVPKYADEGETFFDAITPVDMNPNKENDRPISIEPHRSPFNRDSHDLSLPNRHVRDSLMSNMLLSLDQFGGGPPAASRTTFEDPLYSVTGGEDMARTMTAATTRPGRLNGGSGAHHSYTYSSDFDGTDDASRMSSNPSRGRRSNSSSGFQSSLGRINSMRESLRRGSQPGTPRHLHSRGGRGSKSSSTNSIDAGYAQVLGSQRWAHGIGRSSSFDHGHSQTNIGTAAASRGEPWHIQLSNTMFDTDYDDAAPTPTVPGGPRRLNTVPSMPSLPRPAEPAETSPERKRSVRSSRSATVGRQAQPKQSDIPPVPAFDLDSAPAPHVGYEKSKEPVPKPTNGMQSAQPQQKQGFFRRMFGSRKDATPEAPPLSSAPISSESLGSKSRNQSMKSQSAPPSRDSHHGAPTLQKKPSSFFRRRKKSVTESDPPPMPPPMQPPMPPPKPTADEAELLRPKPQKLPERNSATSLRLAMSQYLKDSPIAPVQTVDSTQFPQPPSSADDDARYEQRRNTRGFSPDYEPPPSATIRSVDQAPAGPAEPRKDTPTRRPPEPPHPARSGSFLNDDSDSEQSPRRQMKKPAAYLTERAAVVDRRGRSRSSSPSASKKLSPASSRLPLQNADTDDAERPTSKLSLPIEGVVSPPLSLTPTEADYRSTPLAPPKSDSSQPSPTLLGMMSENKGMDEPAFVIGEPTEDDRQKAKRIFDGSEDFIQKEKAAAWMGEEGLIRQRTLRAYMDLHDFKDQSVVNGLRDVCSRLILRAETQQVDRILVAFSRRWCECNPNHGFKSSDVIHTMCYSIMLLNTDLHLADIEHRMTRSQFLKNTMTTVKQALADSVPGAFNHRASILPGRGNTLTVDGKSSVEFDRTNSFRNSILGPLRTESSLGHRADPDDCGPLVKTPFEGTLRAWEAQVEIVLKDTYASVRDDRLPLHGAEATQTPAQNNLSVINMLKRTPSVLSKTPSEGQSSTRGRIAEAARSGASRWTSKSRSRPRLATGGGHSSSRTSFDDGNSLWSPADSTATWSRQSLGRTQASMSMDSFNSAFPRGDYQQSIGFANALSQAIIREDALGSVQSLASDEITNGVKPMLDDESLELAGPPWIKEGIVIHKHHLDGIDKKAKERNWTEVFAVVQKGSLSIFSFTPSKSLRNKGRNKNIPKGAVVGGGNWQENATNLGTFSLKQTLASALPPPGYSRQRPYVWALSLPTGAVHLFQVGTPEICKEFVTTANYWSARLSTHPLVGGISNIEYGWSDAIVNNALVSAINESSTALPNRAVAVGANSRPGSAAAGRISTQSRGSFRSGSLDFGTSHSRSGSASAAAGVSAYPSAARPGKLPGDRIHIADWTPPTQSLRPANAPEPEQLATLLAYVRGVEEELQTHNALRSPMLLAFTLRGNNAAKAMANWERKSAYLLRETVKFRTYVDCLEEAEGRRTEIYREREVARRAARGEGVGSLDIEREDEANEFGMRDGEEDSTLRA